MQEKNKKIVRYTIFFSIVSLFIACLFLYFHKGYISKNDGIHQHYVNLVYFRRLLIDFFKTGDFNLFSWNVALGKGMMANLAYFTLGDFLSYFSVLFNESSMDIFYSLLTVGRMFLAGLTFIFYTNYKKKSVNSSVLGALLYTFCTYSLWASVRQPFFTNAMILFPIVMIGIEKLIIEDKKLLFIISIALIYISSFYFAYMISLCIAIYGIILIIQKYKEQGIKVIIKKIFITLLCAIIGVMISAFILLPSGIEFLNSSRSYTDTIYPYAINYYRNLILSPLTHNGNNWSTLGTGALGLLTLILSIIDFKKNKKWIMFFIILMLPLLISQLGSVFSGFSYPNNRWVFVISFIWSYLSVKFLDSNRKIRKKDNIIIGIIFTIYFALLIIIEKTLTNMAYTSIISLILLLITLNSKELLLHKSKRINLYNLTINIITIINICMFSYYLYGIEGYNYMEEFINVNSPQYVYDTNEYTISRFDEALEYIYNDKDYYRISKYPSRLLDASIYYDYNSINQYYSITSEEYSNLGLDLSNVDYNINYELDEFNYRTKITTLLGTKYSIREENMYLPYGYESVKKIKDTKIYENKYAVPFGTLYTNYITEEEYKKLSDLERENALLKTVTLNENNINNQYVEKNNDLEKDLDSDIVKLDIEKISEGTLTINKASKKNFYIPIESEISGELYLKISNINYEPFSKLELKNAYLNNLSNEYELNEKYLSAVFDDNYKFYQKNYAYTITTSYKKTEHTKEIYNKVRAAYYYEMDNYLVNLGYYKSFDGKIKINLSELGVYTYDDIEVFIVNFDSYENDINNLKRSNFKVDNYDDNYMEATVDTEENGVLQFSTTYSKGWNVYVDNKKVNSFKVNNYFLGINIEKGSHTIKLVYETPYLKEGKIISIVGILILGGVIYKEKNLKKYFLKKKNKTKE